MSAYYLIQTENNSKSFIIKRNLYCCYYKPVEVQYSLFPFGRFPKHNYIIVLKSK